MKRHPATDLVGHLMFTRTGVTWATWRIAPLAYNKQADHKRLVARLHAMLLRGLGGEALLFSSMVPEDPMSAVERMIDDLDLAQLPGWVRECEASLDSFAELGLGQRYHWLSVPLANTGRQRATAPMAAAARSILDVADLPVHPPTEQDIAARLEQAARVEALIPSPFRPQPVTVAEQVWCARHAMRRGLVDEPLPEMSSDQVSGACVMPSPLIDPGARTDGDKAPSRFNVAASRVVKVTDPSATEAMGLPPTYQVLLAASEMPVAGLSFPGSEILSWLDTTGVDVDWALRLRINQRQTVLRRNRRAVRKLNEQFDQRELETTTGLHDLDIAAGLLQDYDQLYASDRDEVEVEHTFVFAVGAAAQHPDQSAAEVNSAAQELATTLTQRMSSEVGVRLERLPNTQVDLWQSMLPGYPTSATVKAYRQYTSAGHLAKVVPFTESRLGGDRGPAVFVDQSTARPRLVHHDLGSYAELDISQSVLFLGELGSGKSVGQKTLCSHLVDQGGQFVAIDKGEAREWGRFVETFDSHTVVDALNPAWSMDPLRILPIRQGAPLARATLVTLLNLDTQDYVGLELARALGPANLERHQITGLGELTAHLMRGAAHTQELGRRLDVWAQTPIGRVLFDPALPPVDLTVDATAWLTYGMSQPTEAEMNTPHLFRGLAPEKIFGRAYYHLLIHLARLVCYADPSRPTLFNVDELYDATQNPANIAVLTPFVRDSRKARTGLCAGGHSASDPGDDVLAGLIPTRVIMRTRDTKLAAEAVRYVGFNDDDPDFTTWCRTVQEDLAPLLDDDGVPPERRGECVLRDAYGNVGRARLLPPANPVRRAAVLTTPPRSKVRQR